MTPTSFVLVIPTLNESGNIRLVLDRAVSVLAQTPFPWQVLVVDDCSADGTGEIVQCYAQANSHVLLVTRRGERGLAGAITYGWSQTNASLLGVMDADLQHPPELLPALLDQVKRGADLAIASRYIQPHSMDGWNAVRKLLSKISVMASLAVQNKTLRVKDPLSGFFVVRRECIDGIEFQKTGFKLLLEILARGRVRRAVEVPFKFAIRENGVSKANAMTGVHYGSLLLKLLWAARGRPETRV